MATVALPYTLTPGQPENVTQLTANLDALVAGVNSVATAQINDAAVTTAKIADGNVTADKLGGTLAGQLGVSQTGTDRSVTVTQTAELTTTNAVGAGDTIATSSELTTPANGLLRVVFFAEAKSSQSSPSGVVYVFPLLNDAGTFRFMSNAGSKVYFGGSTYTIDSLSSTSVTGTTYKKIAGLVTVPFVSGGIESSTGKSQFRLGFLSSSASYTAYVKNVTATMTYIAV